MITDLKPYPAMKDSGVEWLGEVPEHWEVRRTKLAFQRIVGGSTPSSNESRYWGGPHIWVTPADISKTSHIRDSPRLLTQEGLDSCSADLLPAGSVVVTSRAPVGNVALAEVPFCTNQGCKALVPNMDQVHSLFAFHMFECLQAELQSLANGTTFSEISGNRLGDVRIPLPPLPEQAAIVRYLDHVDRRVRRLVRAKRKLIALLTEQKQAIIHRAVTRGLDPDVPLKDSGVEWLGEVPEHWEVRRGKYFFREVDERSATGLEELLSVSHLTGVTPRSQKNITMFKAESYVGSKICKPGQIAINTMWAWMGPIGVSRHHGIISPSYHTYEQKQPARFAEDYLDLLVRTDVYKTLYRINSTGITSSRMRLYPEEFLNIEFLCPPLEEQNVLLDSIHVETQAINDTIARANREIELLNEYRTRLIADVVTGKLDVRDAAAALPEVDPLTEFNDADDLESDLDMDAGEPDEVLEEVEA